MKPAPVAICFDDILEIVIDLYNSNQTSMRTAKYGLIQYKSSLINYGSHFRLEFTNDESIGYMLILSDSKKLYFLGYASKHTSNICYCIKEQDNKLVYDYKFYALLYNMFDTGRGTRLDQYKKWHEVLLNHLKRKGYIR